MQVLVIGKGGREHALVRALKSSKSVTKVHASPGSDGIARDAICHKVNWSDANAVADFLSKNPIDLVVIGPEVELVGGMANQLRELGLLVVGPDRDGAQLEGSKVFAKRFMKRAGVPTARSFEVENVSGTLEAAKNFKPPFVLKADGLAAGKGVFICDSLEELRKAATDIFENRTLGAAGASALLEEFSAGYELSYLILTNANEFQALPIAQDHKRLLDGQKGPNTGGMGTIAPMEISATLKSQIENLVVRPTLLQMQKEKMNFRGIVFIGLMVSESGPSVLEYNVRFGDPETQVLLPLLEGDWGLVFKALAEGEIVPLKFKSQHLACVVLASPGYPDSPEKGVQIEGDLDLETEQSYFLHAGTRRGSEMRWETDGGRVLNAIGVGSTKSEAIKRAYDQASQVSWKGLLKRSDIGRS